ncbi:unnamed protein product [Owenia fusiformis]|uniref:protein-tyrosine-phosphatase n=1 Tax=Owenia fusiformis TaxID=6347 RepID=A0A8J1T601_OWEFU|nr:unnamed protein product [Owenia fusiformis]
MALQASLQKFLAKVERLSILDKNGIDGFQREFTALKDKSNQYKVEKTYPTTEGEKQSNRKKNRYKDILPFDYTRVPLENITGHPGSDYINASFIKSATGKKSYIASQGPLPHTVNDFWRLIWEYDASIVIMSCREVELGKPKCERYWAEKGEPKLYGTIEVTMVKEQDHYKEFTIRTLRATKKGETRVIKQYHYIKWPDHGVPDSALPILDMIAMVREDQSQEEPPLVVHCSAGCGRTGAIIAIDYAWTLLKTGKLTADFDIFDILSEMRKQRLAFVQAKDQYELVNRAVAELFERHLLLMDKHLYENMNVEKEKDPAYDSPCDVKLPHTEESEYEDVHPSQLAIRRSIHELLNNDGLKIFLQSSPPKPSLAKKPDTLSFNNSNSDNAKSKNSSKPPISPHKPRLDQKPNDNDVFSKPKGSEKKDPIDRLLPKLPKKTGSFRIANRDDPGLSRSPRMKARQPKPDLDEIETEHLTRSSGSVRIKRSNGQRYNYENMKIDSDIDIRGRNDDLSELDDLMNFVTTDTSINVLKPIPVTLPDTKLSDTKSACKPPPSPHEGEYSNVEFKKRPVQKPVIEEQKVPDKKTQFDQLWHSNNRNALEATSLKNQKKQFNDEDDSQYEGVWEAKVDSGKAVSLTKSRLASDSKLLKQSQENIDTRRHVSTSSTKSATELIIDAYSVEKPVENKSNIAVFKDTKPNNQQLKPSRLYSAEKPVITTSKYVNEKPIGETQHTVQNSAKPSKETFVYDYAYAETSQPGQKKPEQDSNTHFKYDYAYAETSPTGRDKEPSPSNNAAKTTKPEAMYAYADPGKVRAGFMPSETKSDGSYSYADPGRARPGFVPESPQGAIDSPTTPHSGPMKPPRKNKKSSSSASTSSFDEYEPVSMSSSLPSPSDVELVELRIVEEGDYSSVDSKDMHADQPPVPRKTKDSLTFVSYDADPDPDEDSMYSSIGVGGGRWKQKGGPSLSTDTDVPPVPRKTQDSLTLRDPERMPPSATDQASGGVSKTLNRAFKNVKISLPKLGTNWKTMGTTTTPTDPVSPNANPYVVKGIDMGWGNRVGQPKGERSAPLSWKQ